MVGFLLVVQMPHSRDVGAVPISFCPVDCLRLCSADVENMILMVFDHIVNQEWIKTLVRRCPVIGREQLGPGCGEKSRFAYAVKSSRTRAKAGLTVFESADVMQRAIWENTRG